MNKIALIFEVEATETLTVTVLPENTADKSIRFSSNDTAIAIVTPVQGKVTGVAVETTTVTGTAVNGKTTTYEVTAIEAGGGT